MARSADRHLLQILDDKLEREWDELAVRSGSPPFVRPGWIREWMAAFAPGQGVQVVAVKRGGELTAVLPLVSGRWRLRSPTNGESMAFSPVVADADAAAELADRLLARQERIVDLSVVPAGRGAPAEIMRSAAERRGAAVLTRTMTMSPFLDVSGSWSEFNQRLSAKRRQGMRRLGNRLADVGRVTFDVHDGRSDLDALLEDGFRLEAREWKRAAGSAILSHPSTTRFYTSVARWAADVDVLRLAFLRLDGHPIAFSYNLQDSGRLYGLKLGMDDEYAKSGPGVVISHRLIEYAFAEPGLVQFDFLGQNDPYKAEYASGTCEHVRLQIFPGGRAGRLQREAVARSAALRSRLVSRLPDAARARLSAVRNRLAR